MSPLAFLILIGIAAIAAISVWRTRKITVIYPPHVGLLYRNGRFVREMAPGRYARFDLFKQTHVIPVSLAEAPAAFGEITVLSKDQFSFRLALAATTRVVDARSYIEAQGSVSASEQHAIFGWAQGHAYLHTLATAAAVEVAAGKTLTEMLADQAGLRKEILTKLADAVPGAAVVDVLLTGINLPPETRKMFTDVERTKLEAQASLERARGEQASLRVLANAARLLTDNPALGNLRLLQAIESSKGKATVIIGEGAAGLGLAKSD